MKEYNGKVRVVFKNMVVHPQVEIAHLAGCAAGKQGKFQQFKNTWWEKAFKTRKMDEENINAIAKEIGLNMDKFKAALDNNVHKAKIDADAEAGNKAGINGTPAFVINGYYISGAQPESAFKKLINRALKEAEGK